MKTKTQIFKCACINAGHQIKNGRIMCHYLDMEVPCEKCNCKCTDYNRQIPAEWSENK